MTASSWSAKAGSQIAAFYTAVKSINAVALPNLPNDYPLGNYFVQQPHRVTTHEAGVRVDHVVRGGDRVGIYFAETGASQRASTVIYDRAHHRDLNNFGGLAGSMPLYSGISAVIAPQ